MPIVVDLWGPRACFTPPYAKVERLSTAVPTPSAMRGILASIYNKPSEFYWTVSQIEVMNPIKYQSCKRNEVNARLARNMPISIEASRTQRAMTMLMDVRYRVTAIMHPKQPGDDFEAAIRAQALRRIRNGQCFLQPYFGIRECECYFALSDMKGDPIPVTQDYNLMTYDTCIPGDMSRDGNIHLSLYHCTMVNGVIRVPDYDSSAVLKLPSPDLIVGGAPNG